MDTHFNVSPVVIGWHTCKSTRHWLCFFPAAPTRDLYVHIPQREGEGMKRMWGWSALSLRRQNVAGRTNTERMLGLLLLPRPPPDTRLQPPAWQLLPLPVCFQSRVCEQMWSTYITASTPPPGPLTSSRWFVAPLHARAAGESTWQDVLTSTLTIITTNSSKALTEKNVTSRWY